MKIMNGTRVYVENIDVAFFFHHSYAVPDALIAEVLKQNAYFVVPNENGMAFENYFEWPMNTRWLMEQDWIEDYDFMTALEPRDLRTYRDTCILKRNQILLWYDGQEVAEKAQLRSRIQAIIAEEDHRLLSLQALIETQNDESLEIRLPEELEKRIVN